MCIHTTLDRIYSDLMSVCNPPAAARAHDSRGILSLSLSLCTVITDAPLTDAHSSRLVTQLGGCLLIFLLYKS